MLRAAINLERAGRLSRYLGFGTARGGRLPCKQENSGGFDSHKLHCTLNSFDHLLRCCIVPWIGT